MDRRWFQLLTFCLLELSIFHYKHATEFKIALKQVWSSWNLFQHLLLISCLMHWFCFLFILRLKAVAYSSLWEVIFKLRSIACYMGSHRLMCCGKISAKQVGTQFTYPRGMKGWVDLVVGYIPRWFTRVIPKVSGLNILDNNIFHSLHISKMYILYEL